ncbi:MAG: hypothetical protein MI862_02070 [Desulfobacterales bacterium]|nr:hypothetical protein [Desulfobacterales bacterium]
MAQTYSDNCYAPNSSPQVDMPLVEQNFAALKSSFSGASAPANSVAGMWWYDTGTHILKIRNRTNSAWQNVWDLAKNKPVITNLSNEITAPMINSALKSPIAGVEGLRTLGVGAKQACAGNDSRLSDKRAPLDAVPGSILVGGSDDIEETRSAVMTKIKEVTVGFPGGYRIDFNLNNRVNNVVFHSYAQIYRNGSAVGALRSVYNNESKTFSQNIYGWRAGDLCQIYGRSQHQGTPIPQVSNLRLYVSQAMVVY